ncbi:MAG: hypothetical protein ACE5HI_09755 [bacterium]
MKVVRIGELIKRYLEFDEFIKNLEKRDQNRYSLWNSLIVFNSIIISAFAIVLAINPNHRLDGLHVLSFFILVLVPILLLLINHLIAYVYYNRKATDSMTSLMSYFPDKFSDTGEQEPKNHNDKRNQEWNFFKKCNTFLKYSERISLACSLTVLIYFFKILWQLIF